MEYLHESSVWRFLSRLAKAVGLAPSLLVQPFSGTAAAPQAGFSEVSSTNPLRAPLRRKQFLVPGRLPLTGAPAANLQGTTREFKYTSSIVYPSALTALATLGSMSDKPR